MVWVQKDDLVEIRLRKKGTKEYFPEMEDNGQAYIIAEPGQDFEVVVNLIDAGRPPLGSRPRNDTDSLLVWPTLNGQDPGYSLVLSMKNTEVVFEGFYMHVPADAKTHSLEFRAFRFASASQAHQPGLGAKSVASAVAGQLKVNFHWSKATGILEYLKPYYANSLCASGTYAPKEDKKFFMMLCMFYMACFGPEVLVFVPAHNLMEEPSLCCTSGQRELREFCCSNTKYETLSSYHVVIRYETAATLLLRKVLDPSVPAHKAILTASGLQKPAQQGSAGKREREEVARDPLRPPTAADKRMCGKDEMAHCDLTGDGPVWEIRKKPHPREVIEL